MAKGVKPRVGGFLCSAAERRINFRSGPLTINERLTSSTSPVRAETVGRVLTTHTVHFSRRICSNGVALRCVVWSFHGLCLSVRINCRKEERSIRFNGSWAARILAELLRTRPIHWEIYSRPMKIYSLAGRHVVDSSTEQENASDFGMVIDGLASCRGPGQILKHSFDLHSGSYSSEQHSRIQS